jgi:hypothetical protein
MFMVASFGLLALSCAKDGRATVEYKSWTMQYYELPPTNQARLRLVVTTVTGEVDRTVVTNVNIPFLERLREVNRKAYYGFEVSTNGDLTAFSFGGSGAKGYFGRTLSPVELKRLDKLISKLPSDEGKLPPPGERVVVQAAQKAHWKVFVYDRRKAPIEVGQISQLVGESQ